jgi:hypothetical protein
MSGRPVLAHRDLGNSLSAMLRPRGMAWFHPRTGDEAVNNDASARAWLDNKGDVMRRIMYDQRSQFTRATKQGDHDFVAFGQTPIAVDLNKYQNGILYRAFHLKDVVWCENDELIIDIVHHNWAHEARALLRKFPDTVSQKVKDLLDKEPYREIKCRRIFLPADDYDLAEKKPKNKDRFPFVAIMVDCENDTILEEVPARRVGYVIPRWQTVPGSQYAHSPCIVAALPDARLLQQITLTLLEAGQKAVDPPLKATKEAIVGAVNAYSGALTWVDNEYDERMGAALEPLIDTSRFNFGFGQTREEKIERVIQEAFFLNVINLPEATGGDKMTAYETQERVKEYIRRALPLFEPMEVEYNGGLCEMTWNLCMDLNAFGSFEDMPPVLASRDIVWQFESPLQAANERVKSEAFKNSAELLAVAAQIDPTTRADFDVSKAFRDALSGVARADWIVPIEQANAAKQRAAQVAAATQAANAMATGADVATKMGTAVDSAAKATQSMRAVQAPAVA